MVIEEVHVLVSLSLSFFVRCSFFFDLGLYDPHSPRCDARRGRMGPSYVNMCLRVWRGRTMGTHVKTIGTQVYRIYRGTDGGRPRQKNRGVASRRPGRYQ